VSVTETKGVITKATDEIKEYFENRFGIEIRIEIKAYRLTKDQAAKMIFSANSDIKGSVKNESHDCAHWATTENENVEVTAFYRGEE
jgi:hypothetical protein